MVLELNSKEREYLMKTLNWLLNALHEEALQFYIIYYIFYYNSLIPLD